MKKILESIVIMAGVSLVGQAVLSPAIASAADQASTIAALRMNGTVLGGLMPTNDPNFAAMVTKIQAGDYQGAAQIAVGSPYFGKYLARRMAKQMQNVTLNDVGVPDSDATTFVVAHLLNNSGSAVTNSGLTGGISSLFSDNVTCKVNVNGTVTSTSKLSAAQLNAVDWQNQLVCTTGQADMAGIAIPAADSGGYATISTAVNDGSYAMNAFTAGTNLRGIEYLYEISMGLTLLDMAIPTGASPLHAPAFVPENDPNFFIGQGQTACIACHGGGAPNLTHGYATVADLFDYTPNNGFAFIATPTTGTMKSFGSTAGNRNNVSKCQTNHAYPTGFTTCNPDTAGISTSQAWDLSSWNTGGLLKSWGWAGETSGMGLNALGTAVGKASLVYQFMVQRVIGEICPMGTVTAANQLAYAQAGQAADSFGDIVAAVAADPMCR